MSGKKNDSIEKRVERKVGEQYIIIYVTAEPFNNDNTMENFFLEFL